MPAIDHFAVTTSAAIPACTPTRSARTIGGLPLMLPTWTQCVRDPYESGFMLERGVLEAKQGANSGSSQATSGHRQPP
jgi:hypothetical protein